MSKNSEPQDPDVIPLNNVALARRGVGRDLAMAESFQGIVPSSIGEAMQMSATLARSKAVPKSLQSEPESIFTILIAGTELGLTPIRAIQSISVISGNLCMKADLQLALARRSGTLEDYDEGFELHKVTDRGLSKRLPKEIVDHVNAHLEGMPNGKPYGWAFSKRKGESRIHVRVFSWMDAERMKVVEWENGQKKVGKLSERPAYVNNPQDMYPKRARGRVLQITHSDVLSGMPAIESMDGLIEAEGVVVQPTSTEAVIGELVGEIRGRDPEKGDTVATAFEQLALGPAKRLQLLKQFKGNVDGLLSWLRDEYAKRKTSQPKVTKDVLGGQAAPGTTTKPVDPQADQAPERPAVKPRRRRKAKTSDTPQAEPQAEPTKAQEAPAAATIDSF